MRLNKHLFTTTWAQVAVVIFIIAIASAASVITGTKTKSIKKLSSSLKSSAQINRLTSSADKRITKDWKTYTSSQHHYSFKYPSSWNVKDNVVDDTSNVYIYDTKNTLIISLNGISDNQECKPRKLNPESRSFLVGNRKLLSNNWCSKDTFSFSLIDTQDRFLVVYVNVANTSEEATSEQVLKSVENLNEVLIKADNLP